MQDPLKQDKRGRNDLEPEDFAIEGHAMHGSLTYFVDLSQPISIPNWLEADLKDLASIQQKTAG